MAKKADLLLQAKELGLLNVEELNYNDLKSAVSKAKKTLDTDENTTTTSTTNPPYFKDEKGSKYGFTRKTPKSFRFNGVVKKQAEWLKDTDAMEMLVYGNSTYIKKLKN